MGTDAAWADLLAWAYLITNGARVLTYVPQILAVWRCSDGARAISLLTWGSWVVSHAMAALYGVLVVYDLFLAVVSCINLVCCGLVVGIACQRRKHWTARLRQAAA